MYTSDWQEIIKIDVNIRDVEKVVSSTSKVIMISFDGYASGDFFTGNILPGAIDTQQQEGDSELYLSARYMLSGMDYMDKKCRIFIENSGVVKNDEQIIYATPKIITDSENLKWLESASLKSYVIPNKNGVQVLIYCLESDRSTFIV